MDFKPKISLVQVIEKGASVVLILETFILVYMVNFIKTFGKNLKN